MTESLFILSVLTFYLSTDSNYFAKLSVYIYYSRDAIDLRIIYDTLNTESGLTSGIIVIDCD